MLIRELIVIALLFLRIVSSNNFQWHDAIEFWSNVICSMEDCKTVHFHRVLDNGRDSHLVSQCSDVFIYNIARKCGKTIVSNTFTSPNLGNASFADNDDIIYTNMKWSSILKITSGDIFFSRAKLSAIKRTQVQRNRAMYGRNTWNVHVLLAGDIYFLDHISKNSSTFEWNSQDRFIILIAQRKQQRNPLNISIHDILKTLWLERKIQSVFVSEAILVENTTQIYQIVRTYNPFAKVNDSVWGKIEIININTVKQASAVLSNIVYRRTKNLNKYKLKVGIFKKNQSTVEKTARNSVEEKRWLNQYIDTFYGFDEKMLDAIAQYMNFEMERIHPTDNKSFGYQLSNGTYVGAIGDVVYGRTDVCFQSFFVKKYGMKFDVEFTTYVEFDRVCVIVPKAPKIPKWLRIYHFFPPPVWICSILTHIFTYVTWHFLQIFDPQRTEKVNFLEIVYRSFLLNAGCPQKLPSTNAERILVTSIFLASITLVGIFNGILYNSFARNMYYQDIDTLKDLDASGLLITFASPSMNDIFGSWNDVNATSLMRNLKSKLRHGYNGVTNAAYYRNNSGLMREYHFPITSQWMIDADGAPLLHLNKECPGAFYMSYLLPKKSILRERINILISRLNQAGLPTFWTKHNVIYRNVIRHGSRAKSKQFQNENKTNHFVAFKLSDVQTSFYMLLIGLSVSTIIFFHEKNWLKIPSLCSGRSSSKIIH